MKAVTLQKLMWFWPWQDQKEEAWLEKMSEAGWHLNSVQLPCGYSFVKSEPVHYTYRLDYTRIDKSRRPEYLQIFQDAGWEYIGEMTNWQYWRKRVVNGQVPEIYTDKDSKLNKYKRLLGYMGFFLFFLLFIGFRIIYNAFDLYLGSLTLITAMYWAVAIIYMVLISIYVVVVIMVYRRIRQLKNKSI
jgi:hypothetical protein